MSRTDLHPTVDPSLGRPLRRRRVAALGLLLAPVLTVIGAASWPAGSDGSTADELRAAAAQPALWRVASILDVLPWALLLLGAVAVLGYLRGRGGVLGMLGAIGVAGGAFATCVIGGVNLLVVPVVAAQPDRAAAVRFMDSITGQPTTLPFLLLIYIGLIGTVLLTFGALRGGLVRWWVPVLLVVGVVVNVALNDGLSGLAAAATFVPFAVAELLLGLALLRSDRAGSPAAQAVLRPAEVVV
jgi:hypothetical protein